MTETPLLHKHHIIPRYAFKDDRFAHMIPATLEHMDDPSNIIYLTLEEHIEAHKWLWVWFGNEQDEIAWKMLSGRLGKEEGYRRAQLAIARGRKQTKNEKDKQIKAQLGKSKGPNFREKMRNAANKSHGGNRKCREVPKEHKYISPGGSIIVVPIGKTSDFANQYNLLKSAIYDLNSGRQTEHRGWRYAK